MALTLHHLRRSRSHRIIWLFEELGLDYEMKEYARTQAFRAPPELRQIHPLGKAPIVTDGALVLAETGAIIEHVLEAHGAGRLRPAPGTEASRHYRFFLHYAEGSLMPPLLVRLIFDRIGEARLPFFVKPVVRGIVRKVDESYTNAELELHTRFLEDELGRRQWFAGDEFTAADIQMSYPVEALVGRGGRPESENPRLRAWVNRIQARPAYQRALEKGGALF